MAMMSQVQLLLLLVASRFLLPALCDPHPLDWHYCKDDGEYSLMLTDVKIFKTIPNVVLADFHSEAQMNLGNNKFVDVRMESPNGDDLVSYRFCDVVTPPSNTAGQIDPRWPYTMVLHNVKYDKEGKYTVSVRDSDLEPPNELMCAEFVLPDLAAQTLLSA